MKKKKTTIYLYILIAVFTVFVGAATYAFFAGNNNIDAKANLSAETGKTYTFTSTSATNFELNLTSADMQQSQSGNYVSSSLGTIDVSLTSPEGKNTVCTFDLLFTWTSSQKYTTPNVSLPYTSGGTTYNYEFSTLVKDGEAIAFAERDLSNVNNGAGFGTGSSGTIAESLSLSANGDTTTKTYSIEARIYNLPVNQPNLIGKNMKASVKVDNLNCEYEYNYEDDDGGANAGDIEDDGIDVTTLNYLSTNMGNSVFDLVSKQGINIANVYSVYFVDSQSMMPDSTTNVAYFRGMNNRVIRAWTNSSNLYIGSNIAVFPGPSMAGFFDYNVPQQPSGPDEPSEPTANYEIFDSNNKNASAELSSELILIDMNNANTSKVTNMASMFDFRSNNLSNFSLNLGSNFNTSNVTNMAHMFFCLAGVNQLNLGNHFDTSKVLDMSHMFAGLLGSSNFTLDLKQKFNTKNVVNMAYMFSETGSSSANFTLNLGNNFNTSNVVNMYSMFSGAGERSTNFTFNLGNQFNTSKVNDVRNMFDSFGYLSNNFHLDLGNEFNTSNITNMFSMFSYAGSRSQNFSLDLGPLFNTAKVTGMSKMFSSVGANTKNFNLNLGNNFNTSNVTNMSFMFSSTGESSTNFTLNLGNQFNTSKVTNMAWMFSNTGNSSTVFTLNLGNKFNTSNVTDMSNIFRNTGYSSPWTLNLKSFDFSKVGSNYYSFFTNRTSSKVLTVLCNPTNGDFINARVGTFTGYNVVCS